MIVYLERVRMKINKVELVPVRGREPEAGSRK